MTWSAGAGWVCAFGTAGLMAALVARQPVPLESAITVHAAQAESVSQANPLRNAYYGDLHVHTSYSSDAYAFGNRNDPRVAYRYGMGEAIVITGGARSQLRAPLDFMAVTDHDNAFADLPLCLDPTDSSYGSPACRELGTPDGSLSTTAEPCLGLFSDCSGRAATERREIRVHTVWQRVQRNADEFYRPGRFTTFAGYEWTGTSQGMLHRNVIFNGRTLPPTILTAADVKQSPERLWEWLERTCSGLECQAVVIPHNTNFNMGSMMGTSNTDGTPFTRESLLLRARNERLIEIYQSKGDSECAVGVGTTDEDCNFEQLWKPCQPGQKQSGDSGFPLCAVPAQYVRNALKTGMNLERQYGVNPYKLGFIGSTDTHSSNPGNTQEQDWTGAVGTFDDTLLERRARSWNASVASPDTEWGTSTSWNPGGLAGVWAEQNTRESIFKALLRRETFATSGTRVRVRFFAGWNLPADIDKRPTLLQDAYGGGVPMGGDLPRKPEAGTAPRLVVWATKDPNSANLQRLQIIKGYTQGDAALEKTYDIACADGRLPNPRTHRCSDNGATVDLATCSYSPNKGKAEMSATWTDPEFNPSERAFYYARVLENPTCRWSTLDAIKLKMTPPTGVSPTVQERAWSSPIWYTPE